MKRLVVIAALASVVVGVIAVPASAGSLEHCGGSLAVRNVSCQTGRKVLSAVNSRCRNDQEKTCGVLAFTCSASQLTDAVRCTAGDEQIVADLQPGEIGPNGLSNCELHLQNDTGRSMGDGGPSPIDGHGVTSFLGRVESTFGCSITYHFELTESTPREPFHGIVDMRVENPLIGSNEYSCHAQGDFRCFGPRDGSNLRGSDLRVIYYVCIPDEDVKVLGHHLAGYCGKP
jgi:hypothetical protein